MNIALDINIIVYAESGDDPARQARALRILNSAAKPHKLVADILRE